MVGRIARMRWLRIPLLHFLAGGAVLYWLVRSIGAAPPPVVITADDVSRLRLDYTRETELEPTAADEAALVEKAIQEELLFREALAHGLDRDDRSVRNWLIEQMRVLSNDASTDPDALYARARALGLDRSDLVVRRILVQKMRLLAARSGEQNPSDAALEAFYAAHREEYRAPDRASFWHVFLVSAGHGGAAISDGETQLARLRSGGTAPAQAAQSGDSFTVPPHVVGQSRAQIEKLFGAEVARAVEHGDTGQWIGPVQSPYGVHLLWIERREPGAIPPLNAVRQQVVERWLDETRARRVAELLNDLERRYPLRVESAAWHQRRAAT